MPPVQDGNVTFSRSSLNIYGVLCEPKMCLPVPFSRLRRNRIGNDNRRVSEFFEEAKQIRQCLKWLQVREDSGSVTLGPFRSLSLRSEPRPAIHHALPSHVMV